MYLSVKPSTLRVFQYAYCYIGLLTGKFASSMRSLRINLDFLGPYYRYRTYHDWLEMKHGVHIHGLTFMRKRVMFGSIYILTYLLLSTMVSFNVRIDVDHCRCVIQFSPRMHWMRNSIVIHFGIDYSTCHWYLPYFVVDSIRLGYSLSACVCQQVLARIRWRVNLDQVWSIDDYQSDSIVHISSMFRSRPNRSCCFETGVRLAWNFSLVKEVLLLVMSKHRIPSLMILKPFTISMNGNVNHH